MIGSLLDWATNSETKTCAEHNNGCQTKGDCGTAESYRWVVGRVVDAPGEILEGSS